MSALSSSSSASASDPHISSVFTSSASASSSAAAAAAAARHSIVETLRGKCIFLTGATGFVGKVIVEKILRSLPHVERIFILIRPRRGQSAMERMKAEIVSSEVFTRLRGEIKTEEAFQEMIQKKLCPIAGELTANDCGMSASDLSLVLAETHVFIHCAAIVDFNERLDRAIELNVLGSLRLLHIAQKCVQRLDAFVHISTAYVNSNRKGWIDEKLYPLGFDPAEVIAKVSAMKESELEKVTVTGLLGEWPNTYTFTKAMTEHLLVAQRGTVPLAIVRPSIVGCAYREPVPGWVDVLTAAGAVYMSVGLGVLKFLPGSPHTVADVVPVDYVVNAILAAIPAVASQQRAALQQGKRQATTPHTVQSVQSATTAIPSLISGASHPVGRTAAAAAAAADSGSQAALVQTLPLILHACTSTEKPMYWGDPLNVVVKYFQEHPPKRSMGAPTFRLINSPQTYQIQFFLRYSIPATLMTTLAPIATKSYQVKAHQFNRLVFRVRVIIESFRHFVENEWFFNNKNTRALGRQLHDDKERASFELDLDKLDWAEYNHYFAFGLMRFVLKADLVEYSPGDADKHFTQLNSQLWRPIPKNPKLADYLRPAFSDLFHIRDVLAARPHFPPSRAAKGMKTLLLAHPQVQQAMQEEAKLAESHASSSGKPKRSKPGAAAASTGVHSSVPLSPLASAEARANGIMDKMFGDASLPVQSGMGYVFKKIWSRIYRAIRIESSGLAACRALALKGHSLVLIPTHRSYVDFLIISYICFMCHLPMPHIAAGEDFLGILLVRWLFRESGAFFIRRSLLTDDDPLYQCIVKAYIAQLLRDQQCIEFFIEGTRSRSGKMLHPKLGLLTMITQTYTEMKNKAEQQNKASQPGNAHANAQPHKSESQQSNANQSQHTASPQSLVPPVHIIPITINYEKTIESDLYSNELLGESKIKESLKSLLKSSSILKLNFGAISVKFAQPISLDDFAQQNVAQTKHLPTDPARPSMPDLDARPHPNAQCKQNQNQNQNQDAASGRGGPAAAAVLPSSLCPPQTASSLSLQSDSNSNSNSNSASTCRPAYDPFHIDSHRLYLTRCLAARIMVDLTRGLEVMPSHIVATLMLQYRQGITRSQLISKVDWVRRELAQRGAPTYGLYGEDRRLVVEHAIRQLGSTIVQRRKNVFEPCISARQDYSNMLVLGHYRNKLVHHFFCEGIFACALYALTQDETQQHQSNANTIGPSANATANASQVEAAAASQSASSTGGASAPGPVSSSLSPFGFGCGGVSKADLMHQVEFAYALLHREFICDNQSNKSSAGANADADADTSSNSLRSIECCDSVDFEATLEKMIGRDIFKTVASHAAAAAAAAQAQAPPVSSGPESVHANSSSLSLSPCSRIEVSALGESHFSFLCSLFWPFLDSYYVSFLILFSLQPDREIELDVLLQRTQWLAITLYHESMLCFYESCSLDTLRAAFDTLNHWGIIKRSKSRTNPSEPAFGAAATHSACKPVILISLLPAWQDEASLSRLVERVALLRKQPPVRKNTMRRNLIADVPILARI